MGRDDGHDTSENPQAGDAWRRQPVMEAGLHMVGNLVEGLPQRLQVAIVVPGKMGSQNMTLFDRRDYQRRSSRCWAGGQLTSCRAIWPALRGWDGMGRAWSLGYGSSVNRLGLDWTPGRGLPNLPLGRGVGR